MTNLNDQINALLRDIHSVPMGKTKTRKLVKEFVKGLLGEFHTAIETPEEEKHELSHIQHVIDTLQAKLDRNDNPPLKAGLYYTLAVLKEFNS